MTGYLLDTDVIWELRLPSPSDNVREWFSTVHERSLFISPVTVGELRTAIERVNNVQARHDIEKWFLGTFIPRFREHTIPITVEIADRWGRLEGPKKRPIGTLRSIDAILAATALENNLTLVTRDTKRFQRTGVKLLDPWLPPPHP